MLYFNLFGPDDFSGKIGGVVGSGGGGGGTPGGPNDMVDDMIDNELLMPSWWFVVSDVMDSASS